MQIGQESSYFNGTLAREWTQHTQSCITELLVQLSVSVLPLFVFIHLQTELSLQCFYFLFFLDEDLMPKQDEEGGCRSGACFFSKPNTIGAVNSACSVITQHTSVRHKEIMIRWKGFAVRGGDEEDSLKLATVQWEKGKDLVNSVLLLRWNVAFRQSGCYEQPKGRRKMEKTPKSYLFGHEERKGIANRAKKWLNNVKSLNTGPKINP